MALETVLFAAQLVFGLANMCFLSGFPVEVQQVRRVAVQMLFGLVKIFRLIFFVRLGWSYLKFFQLRFHLFGKVESGFLFAEPLDFFPA